MTRMAEILTILCINDIFSALEFKRSTTILSEIVIFFTDNVKYKGIN